MKNAKTIPDLIAELGNSDPKLVDNAGNAILSRGVVALPALLNALRNSTVAARRRLIFLLGELAGEVAAKRPAISEALLSALDDEDWKVRRNAAISLGKLGVSAIVQPILQRLDVESDPRVRVSLILSFGKAAQAEDAEALAAVQLTTDEEQRAARKVRERFSVLTGSVPVVNVEAILSAAVVVELWCRQGVAEIVASEARDKGMQAQVVAADRVAIRSPQNLRQLLAVRSALYPVFAFEVKNRSAHAGGLGARFAQSPVAAEMLRLTPAVPPAYRLSVNLSSADTSRRRDWIQDFATAVTLLENRATGYSWEVIVKAGKGGILLGARPTACRNDRFAYRKEDVPASLHPTLAAAAVRLAAHPYQVLADPFCGSGTLLAERALVAPYRQMFGFDSSPKALQAARGNLADFERISLKQADFAQVAALEPLDLIITNPPYGQRVATVSHARRLHAQLDEIAAKVLRPGGALVVFRPPNFASPARLQVVSRSRVDAGGLLVDLVFARKRE